MGWGTAWQLLPLLGAKLGFLIKKTDGPGQAGKPCALGPWLSRGIVRKGTVMCCQMALMMANAT